VGLNLIKFVDRLFSISSRSKVIRVAMRHVAQQECTRKTKGRGVLNSFDTVSIIKSFNNNLIFIITPYISQIQIFDYKLL
jgi:metal-responsive CopG/Arc/MetJ family transcriptional regulator